MRSAPRVPTKLWEVMEIRDLPSNSIDFHGKSMENHGFPRFPYVRRSARWDQSAGTLSAGTLSAALAVEGWRGRGYSCAPACEVSGEDVRWRDPLGSSEQHCAMETSSGREELRIKLFMPRGQQGLWSSIMISAWVGRFFVVCFSNTQYPTECTDYVLNSKLHSFARCPIESLSGHQYPPNSFQASITQTWSVLLSCMNLRVTSSAMSSKPRGKSAARSHGAPSESFEILAAHRCRSLAWNCSRPN